MFREEMSAQQEPPLGGLLGDSVRDGRRVRRTRRVRIGLGAGTGLAAAVVAGVMVISGTPAKTTSATGQPLAQVQPVLVASSTSSVIKQPPGPKSPTTDAAVVEQLVRLLPSGKTSGFAGGPAEKGRIAFGQAYVDDGQGPGMVRVFVYQGGLSDKACNGENNTKVIDFKEQAELRLVKDEAARKQIREKFNRLRKQPKPGCRDLPGGGRAQLDANGSTGEVSASVDHGKGIVIQVITTTWLAWNGTTNPPGRVALTQAQALKIAAYPGWGARMDSVLVSKAAADYPSLPTVH